MALPGLSAAQLRQSLNEGYDLVSWDPRAVGSTFPPVACFANEPDRQLWEATSEDHGLYQANDSFVQLDAEYRVLATGCEQYSSQLLPYVGTVPTARDLKRLVELYGHSKKLSYV